MREQAPIGRDDVLVISGGGRGVTARCAVGLAHTYGCALVLLGRTPFDAAPEPAWAAGCVDPVELRRRYGAEALRAGAQLAPAQIEHAVGAVLARREIAATLVAIERAGGRAEYVRADITRREALEPALSAALRRHGPATGIVHGAGVLADRRIEHKTPADFALVYAAKVAGLENLLACLPPEQLRHLILFSSVAAFYGNAGQADYAIANEILNKAAHLLRRSHPRARAVAINWGPWDAGMVGPALKAHFAERGVPLIPVEAGVRALLAEIEGGARAPQVIIGAAPGRLAPTPPPAGTIRVWRHIIPGDEPFLADHRLGGHPVLPAVCAAGWMAHAAESLCPGYELARIDALEVLKGIVFAGAEVEEYALDLAVPAAGPGEPLLLEALITGAATGGQRRPHYRARLTLAAEAPRAPALEPLAPRAAMTLDGADVYRDGTLFHGPAFQGIERVLAYGPGGLTLRCRLPARVGPEASRFATGRYDFVAADVAIQGLVIWARRRYGAAGLPLRLGRLEAYGRPAPGAPFTVTLVIRAHDERRVAGDLVAYDDTGATTLRVWGAELTLSPSLQRLFVPADTAAPTP